MGKKQSLGGPFTTKDGIDLAQRVDERTAIPGDLSDTMLAMQVEPVTNTSPGQLELPTITSNPQGGFSVRLQEKRAPKHRTK